MKGSDVYLECDIKANPSVKKVEWFHDVSFAIYIFFLNFLFREFYFKKLIN